MEIISFNTEPTFPFPSDEDITYDCLPTDELQGSEIDLTRPYMIYSIASTALNFILILIWIIRRDWFPIKERSPSLVILTIFGNMMF